MPAAPHEEGVVDQRGPHAPGMAVPAQPGVPGAHHGGRGEGLGARLVARQAAAPALGWGPAVGVWGQGQGIEFRTQKCQ